jgi:flagellar basal-body rod protein FlgG
MANILSIASTGLDAHSKKVAVISNNLANANTPAFKRGVAEFESLMYQTIRQAGSPTSEENQSPSGVTLGTGVKVASTKKIFEQGSQTQTNNPLDLAISGRGFLKVTLPGSGEIAYTRAGNLQVNSEGQMVTSNGDVLEPAITLPAGSSNISISKDGIVSVSTADSSEQTQVGQIEIADFINPAGLDPIGGNLYKATSASGTETAGSPNSNGLGSIEQGAIEGSNVNVVTELVDLIEAQRGFEVTSKAMSTIDQMMQFLNQHL